MMSGQSGVTGGMMDDADIKQELDQGDAVTGFSEDTGVAMDTPRSWDSGVALDSVTALQMAEFQAVVDNLHRQVVSHTSPPPYPGTELDTNMFLTNSLFPSTGAGPHTYQPGHHGPTPKYENSTKNGCHSLPANGIPPKIIDKVENKYASNQRYNKNKHLETM